jgi:hypothetical protein
MASLSSQMIHGRKAAIPEALLIQGTGFAVGSTGLRTPKMMAMLTNSSHSVVVADNKAKTWLTKRLGLAHKAAPPVDSVSNATMRVMVGMTSQ